MAIQLHAVEFVGGPFDGFVRDVWVSPSDLPPFAALPVNANVIASPATARSEKALRSLSVAYYELQYSQGAWRYLFLAIVRKTPRGPAGWWRQVLCRFRKWKASWRHEAG